MTADEEYGAIFNPSLHHKKTDLEVEVIEESTSMIYEKESAAVFFVVLVAGCIMTYYLCS